MRQNGVTVHIRPKAASLRERSIILLKLNLLTILDLL